MNVLVRRGEKIIVNGTRRPRGKAKQNWMRQLRRVGWCLI